MPRINGRMWAFSAFDVITCNVQSNLEIPAEVDLWSILKIGSSTFVSLLLFFSVSILSFIQYTICMYTINAKALIEGREANRSDMKIDMIIIELITIKHFFSTQKLFGPAIFWQFYFYDVFLLLLLLDIFFYTAWLFGVSAFVSLFCYFSRWYITNFSNVYLILLEIRHKTFFIFLLRLRTMKINRHIGGNAIRQISISHFNVNACVR